MIIDGAEGLPEPVVVSVSCGSQSIPQDYTDRRGRFSFQPSCFPALAVSDASARTAYFGTRIGAGRGGLNLSHCWLFAELPGYRSSEIWLGTTKSRALAKVGTIVLTPIANSSGDTVSFTTLTAPKKAKKLYERGAKVLRSVENPSYEGAVPLLERAVELHPEFAAAWDALGRARKGLGDTEGAREAFERSIDSDDRFLKPYASLIEMTAEEKNWIELEVLTDKYLTLAPGSMKFRFYNAFAALKNGKPSKAESAIEMLENAGEMDRWPMSYLVLAEVHGRRGEFEQAAKLYDTFLTTRPNDEISGTIRRTLYDWAELEVIAPVGPKVSTVSNAERSAAANSASDDVAP